MGRRFRSDEAVVPWLVSFAAASVNRGRRGEAGKYPFELRRGRGCKRALAPFGERVLYLKPGAFNGAARVEPRWKVVSF